MSDARDDLPSERELPTGRGGASSFLKRAGIYLAVALVFFLLGLVPMWLRARSTADERDAARRELGVSRMQNALASAAVDAQRGEYEPARKSASEFFNALGGQLDAAATDPVWTAAQRDALKPLLAERDDVITLLARSDPASSARLFDMYAAFREALPAQ